MFREYKEIEPLENLEFQVVEGVSIRGLLIENFQLISVLGRILIVSNTDLIIGEVEKFASLPEMYFKLKEIIRKREFSGGFTFDEAFWIDEAFGIDEALTKKQNFRDLEKLKKNRFRIVK